MLECEAFSAVIEQASKLERQASFQLNIAWACKVVLRMPKLIKRPIPQAYKRSPT